MEEIRESAADYADRFPEFADAIAMYSSIMQSQRKAADRLGCPVEMTDERKEWSLREGVPLLDPGDLEIDPSMYRDTVREICRAVEENRPGGFPYTAELLAWEGIGDDRLSGTKESVLAGEDLALAGSWEDERDGRIALSILWESLVPFYRICGSILYDNKIEQSVWQRGFCPLCGSAPLIGKFRNEDGLWLLECSLCHSQWNVQRASCPFCDEGPGHLEFMYIGEDSKRRVQYCKNCKVYVKTIDMRETGLEGVLPFEDIVTVELDLVASREGLVPPGRDIKRK